MAPGGMKRKRNFIPREGIRELLNRETRSFDLEKNTQEKNRMVTTETYHPSSEGNQRHNLESCVFAPNSATESDEFSSHGSSEIPSTEDEAATTVIGSKKRCRGQTLGKGIMKYFTNTGHKMKISVDPVVGRPLNGDKSAKLASQIGIVTRDVLPVPKKWKEMDIKDGLEPGFDHLKIHMDVNIDEPGVRQALVDRLKISSRNQRHKSHKHFVKYATLEEAKNNKPKLCGTQEQWEELCDLFSSDNYKRVCQVNKENRSKLKCKHVSGRKAFVVRLHEISKHELNGEECDRIELYVRTHSTEKDGWKSDEAKDNWEKMVKKREEYAEQGIDKSSAEIVLEVLGHGTGYIKGLGYGPKPPSRRGVSDDASKQLERELLETKEKLEASETRVGAHQEEMSDIKGTVNKLMNFLAERGISL